MPPRQAAPTPGLDPGSANTHLKEMAQDASDPTAPAAAKRPLSPAAERALAEAAARRAERDRANKDKPEELHGRDGLDPVRYGDWEVKGIASDF
jgi:hypothetical protein